MSELPSGTLTVLHTDIENSTFLARYLRGGVYSTPALLARLFGVPRPDVAGALDRLARAGIVGAARAVDGWPGRWVVAGP